MNDSTQPRRRAVRIGLVVLLVLGAFFAILPWLGCLMSSRPGLISFPNLSVTWGMCTTEILPIPVPGQAVSIPGFTGPYLGNVLVGIVYLIAALYVALTKRAL